MARERWKLTCTPAGHPGIDSYGDPLVLAQPTSLLAELARDPASGLEELAPGWYWAEKEPRDTHR